MNVRVNNLVMTYQVGDSASLSKTISEEDVLLFAKLVGDDNPVHLDDEYARTTRFKGRIVHGALVSGLISAVLGTRLPGPGAIYLSQRVKFLHPVRLGDTVTAIVEVTDVRVDKPVITLKTYCVNQVDEIVVDGEAVVLLDSD